MVLPYSLVCQFTTSVRLKFTEESHTADNNVMHIQIFP